jgi:ribosome maturation factor RimP
MLFSIDSFVPACRRRQSYREWAVARSFYCQEESMSTLQTEIEQLLAQGEPRVEVLLAEIVGGGTLRVFIDHPDGVTLALCERVTLALAPLRERYALEVSSPGVERPLTKPDHFRRFVGRRARVRTRELRRSAGPERTGSGEASSGRADARLRRSFTGELVGATDSEITLAADGSIIAIPYAEIRRSTLVEE